MKGCEKLTSHGVGVWRRLRERQSQTDKVNPALRRERGGNEQRTLEHSTGTPLMRCERLKVSSLGTPAKPPDSQYSFRCNSQYICPRLSYDGLDQRHRGCESEGQRRGKFPYHNPGLKRSTSRQLITTRDRHTGCFAKRKASTG